MICWAVKTPEGDIIYYTICEERKNALEAMERYWGVWKKLYSQGFRCVKIHIKEVP
jgi:hypothetical protein